MTWCSAPFPRREVTLPFQRVEPGARESVVIYEPVPIGVWLEALAVIPVLCNYNNDFELSAEHIYVKSKISTFLS